MRASAWVTSRLEFFRQPAWMKQWPFAHTIEMTHRLQDGALEVAHGDHQHERRADAGRDRLPSLLQADRLGARRVDHRRRRAHRWLLAANKLPTGETRADRTALPQPERGAAQRLTTWTTCSAISFATRQGRATMSVIGKTQRLDVIFGPNFRVGGDLRADWPRLHLLRADGGHHQRAQPGAQGPLQRAAERAARRRLAGELPDHTERVLTAAELELRSHRETLAPKKLNEERRAANVHPAVPLACGWADRRLPTVRRGRSGGAGRRPVASRPRVRPSAGSVSCLCYTPIDLDRRQRWPSKNSIY